MVFNATFNNISVKSWWSVLLVEETRVPGDNHQPVTSQRQSLSHVNFKRNITKIILYAIFDKKKQFFQKIIIKHTQNQKKVVNENDVHKKTALISNDSVAY